MVFENFKTCRERRGQAAKSMPTPTHVGRGVGATPPTPRGGRRVEAKSMPRSKSIKENPATEKKGQPGLMRAIAENPRTVKPRGFLLFSGVHDLRDKHRRFALSRLAARCRENLTLREILGRNVEKLRSAVSRENLSRHCVIRVIPSANALKGESRAASRVVRAETDIVIRVGSERGTLLVKLSAEKLHDCVVREIARVANKLVHVRTAQATDELDRPTTRGGESRGRNPREKPRFALQNRRDGSIGREANERPDDRAGDVAGDVAFRDVRGHISLFSFCRISFRRLVFILAEEETRARSFFFFPFSLFLFFCSFPRTI